MKLVINIGHPAHVHTFRNFIRILSRKGHVVHVLARKKDVTLNLLEEYNIPFTLISSKKSGSLGQISELLERLTKLVSYFKDIKSDFILSGFDPSLMQALNISRTDGVSLVIADNRPDISRIPISRFVEPFADHILTFNTVREYEKYIFRNSIEVNSFKELAYLHPNYFNPNPRILRDAGVSKKEEFVILRFVSWNAYHDFSQGGFSLEHKLELVDKLSQYATVFISSESPLPQELEKYRIPIPPHYIHHFLYYAKLLVCDSQTMTTEAGVLGTPAIRSNSFVGSRDMGNFIELEKKYGLIYNIKKPEDAIKKALELVKQPGLKKRWAKKREKLLKDKIDLTSFMVWFIENYPNSVEEFKQNPEIQYRFR